MFEGSEKKLEIILNNDSLKLLDQPPSFAQSLIKKARTQCIHQFSNAVCQAYLLSESSLFIWNHRLLLITCGKTTLANALLYLIKRVGQKNIQACFFQRKNEFFPLKQKTSFHKDVSQIRKKMKGSAYRFGDLDEHHFFLFHLDKEFSPSPKDQTIEILMYSLPHPLSSLFSNPKTTAEEIQKTLNLSEFLPNFTIQDHTFKPEGYSLNAIRGREYCTIHATPQKLGFYISFETNMEESFQSITQKTLLLFKPLKFDLIVFSPSSQVQDSIQVDPSYLKTAFCKKRLSCGFDTEFYSFQKDKSYIKTPYKW